MSMDNLKEAFDSALQADEEYERAIKAQFGKAASRWDRPERQYNERTKVAFELKKQADKTLHMAQSAS